jgi:hypothetical protein
MKECLCASCGLGYQLVQFGAASMIDDRTRTDAARAAEVLAGTGKTLLDAARFPREHIRRSEGGEPLADAVANFLKAKAAENLSDRYLTSLRHRLKRFLADMPKDATTASASTSDIDKFLGGASTFAGNRNNLST